MSVCTFFSSLVVWSDLWWNSVNLQFLKVFTRAAGASTRVIWKIHTIHTSACWNAHSPNSDLGVDAVGHSFVFQQLPTKSLRWFICCFWLVHNIPSVVHGAIFGVEIARIARQRIDAALIGTILCSVQGCSNGHFYWIPQYIYVGAIYCFLHWYTCIVSNNETKVLVAY